MLVVLDKCHGIYYHYNRLVGWWQSVSLCPRSTERCLDCSQEISLVPLTHGIALLKGWIRLEQRGWTTHPFMAEGLHLLIFIQILHKVQISDNCTFFLVHPESVVAEFGWHHSIARPWKPSTMRKHLGDISYRSWVIADFASNFVAMATGVCRGRICLASFNSPSPKTPCYTQKSRGYLLYKPSYSRFCLKFRCHGNRGHPGVNLNDAVKLAVPENHTLEPKSTVKIGPTGASIGAWKKRKKWSEYSKVLGAYLAHMGTKTPGRIDH